MQFYNGKLMMNQSSKQLRPTQIMLDQFIEKACYLYSDVKLLKVLKSNTYKIGEANVLVRAASNINHKFFFGINYLTLEEISNLDNPFIAFICGSVDKILIIPATVLFTHLPEISHDRNGEYKLNIDMSYNLILSGRRNRLACNNYFNSWDLLSTPSVVLEDNKNNIEDSLHSVLQGRVIEIGNIRGFKTYCPNKSKTFNQKKIDDITSVKVCPKLEFSDYDLLRQIDVIWFKQKGEKLIPEKAFEIEISTGVWSGVGRMGTLLDYSHVGLFIIANDARKFKQVISSFHDISNRYKFISNEHIGDLYSAELNLKRLSIDVGL